MPNIIGYLLWKKRWMRANLGAWPKFGAIPKVTESHPQKMVKKRTHTHTHVHTYTHTHTKTWTLHKEMIWTEICRYIYIQKQKTQVLTRRLRKEFNKHTEIYVKHTHLPAQSYIQAHTKLHTKKLIEQTSTHMHTRESGKGKSANRLKSVYINF